MTWFFVDDHLHDHRKARKACLAAVGLWTLAGSWCADNLTDGFVPADVALRWARTEDVLAALSAELVSVRLWEPVEVDGDPGWQFHDWADIQQTRAEVLEKREKRQRAGRIGGKASGASRAAVASAQATAKPPGQASAEASASAIVEPPSLPLPSLPLQEPPSSSGATAPDEETRPDVEHLCTLLADLIEANGCKRPTITKSWRTECRRMIDRDGREPAKAENLMRWALNDPFWKTNILSMPTFREKYDRLRMKATAEWDAGRQSGQAPASKTDAALLDLAARIESRRAAETVTIGELE